MRTFCALLATLALLAGAATAAGARGPGATKPPPLPNLPGDWSHAEINVKVRGVPHTLILDRGRITQVAPSQLTLREADGSVVQIQTSPATLFAFKGFGYRPHLLKRGEFALAMAIDDGAAVRVRITRR